MVSASPIGQLGQRPHGTDLWSWLYHYLIDNVGVGGYDTSLGALAPSLRLRMHITSIIFLWAIGYAALRLSLASAQITTPAAPADDCLCFLGLSLQAWRCGLAATWFYGLAMYLLQDVAPGVSVPGGPRPHKLQRTPQWKDHSTRLDEKTRNKWRCAVAQDAHDVTHQSFCSSSSSSDSPSLLLTGEPFGRQIWTTIQSQLHNQHQQNGTETTASRDVQPSPADESEPNPLQSFVNFVLSPNKNNNNNNKSKNIMVDETMVQILASGGRDETTVSGGAFNPAKNPNSCDMLFRAQQIRNYLARGGQPPKPLTSWESLLSAHHAAYQAAHFYSMLQTDDGHWAGDYGGPHFLLPGLVTAWYIMGKPAQMLSEDHISLLIHYILVHQQTDGGWGTHIESPSTMFGSTLMYVALRLLGLPADHDACVQGRRFLQENGGALYTSSWSKFYLCLLGCMEWEGHNSVPPELWLLPNWFPFHPGRLWCHCRMVYLPMGYLYGHRFVYSKASTDPLIQSLREELYCEPYDSISWMETRHWVAPMDNYSPIPWVMKTLQNGLARYESWSVFQPFKRYLRRLGLEFSRDYMHAEDLQTNFIDIGPVNKVLNMISAYHGTWIYF